MPDILRGMLAAAAVTTAAAFAAPLPAAAQTAGGSSPCDYAPQLPQCVAALGPLADVSATWTQYQAALVQVVPISDYSTDPEDSPPPLGVGVCGGETAHPASDGTPIPAATVSDRPPPGVPAPPGTHGPYCVLRYIAADFTAPCTGCHRLLLDFSAIPAGNSTSPGADGHWAARFSASQLNVSAPFDGHSPNIKNLCSDKFFNPSPGADCTPYAQTDGYGLEFEGDSSIYHHYPLEGRYYNGPAYLAGNGTTIPYHYVQGAYFDVDPHGTTGLSMWYGAGYRGKGDAAPDTDQSYGCLCEVPPVGHSAYTASYPLASAPASSSNSGSGGSGGGGHAPTTGNSAGAATVASLPNTAQATPRTAVPFAAALALLASVLAAARRRRLAPQPNQHR